jgi:protein AIR1/2
MASASLVQVIDLTDSPPYDNATKKSLKSPDYDIRATATRMSRKRKNGETNKTRTLAESQDFSAEEENAKSDEVVEIPRAESSKGGNGESPKKRNRRSMKSKDKGKDLVSSSLEDTQQDSPPTIEHGQLFFVDTTPASIPVGMAFDSGAVDAPQSPSSQAPEADKIPPLLLPAHVSVLDAVDGLPVQIVQPVDSDSDTESYIEYLDYDDRLVRSSHPFTTIRRSLHTDSGHGALL